MTSKTNVKVSRGEVIFFSQGEYSDFVYCGQVVFTKDCNLAEEVRAYRKVCNQGGDDYSDELYGFAGWLIAKEYCLPLDCREIYLGSYSKFDEDFLALPPSPTPSAPCPGLLLGCACGR